MEYNYGTSVMKYITPIVDTCQCELVEERDDKNIILTLSVGEEFAVEPFKMANTTRISSCSISSLTFTTTAIASDGSDPISVQIDQSTNNRLLMAAHDRSAFDNQEPTEVSISATFEDRTTLQTTLYFSLTEKILCNKNITFDESVYEDPELWNFTTVTGKEGFISVPVPLASSESADEFNV